MQHSIYYYRRWIKASAKGASYSNYVPCVGFDGNYVVFIVFSTENISRLCYLKFSFLKVAFIAMSLNQDFVATSRRQINCNVWRSNWWRKIEPLHAKGFKPIVIFLTTI